MKRNKLFLIAIIISLALTGGVGAYLRSMMQAQWRIRSAHTELTISPDILDFGTGIVPGQQTEQYITVSNIGEIPLYVNFTATGTDVNLGLPEDFVLDNGDVADRKIQLTIDTSYELENETLTGTIDVIGDQVILAYISNAHIWVNDTDQVAAFALSNWCEFNLTINSIVIDGTTQNWANIWYHEVPWGMSPHDPIVVSESVLVGDPMIYGNLYNSTEGPLDLGHHSHLYFEMVLYIKLSEEFDVGDIGADMIISALSYPKTVTVEDAST